MKKIILLLVAITVSACSQQNNYHNVVWKDFTNQEVRLKAYKGRWVVVNYWATWCKPCIKEMPILQTYYEQFSPNVVIIGANIEYGDGFVSEQAIVQFTHKLNLTFPIVKANLNLDKTSLGKIKALPTTSIINPKGEIVYTHIGEINRSILDQHIILSQ